MPDVRIDRFARALEAEGGSAAPPGGTGWHQEAPFGIAVGTPASAASLFPPQHPGPPTAAAAESGPPPGAGASSVDYVLGRIHLAEQATPSVALQAARTALAEARAGAEAKAGPDDFLAYLRGFQTRTEELRRRFDYATALHGRAMT